MIRHGRVYPARETMHISTGTRLGPYEITAPIGAGGMGEVYRARDTRLGREVAIKVLPRNVASDPERLARFEREARSASALNHRNIVTVHDFSTTDGETWIVMELVRGESLREILSRGPLPLKRIVSIGAGIAGGLAAAHAAGIVHRDLKPENVIVMPDGTPKILDFGLVKQTITTDPNSPTELQVSKSGVVMGTAAYMSPEQARGSDLDFRTDQFSLGLMLHEMTTGRHPFARPTGVDTLSAILNDEPPRLDSALPEAFTQVVERCLSKEPSERYGSTADLTHDLARIRDRAAGGLTETAAASRQNSAWKRWLIGAAALVAVLIAAIVAMRAWPHRDAAPQPVVFASIAIPEIAKLVLTEVSVPVAISPDGHYVVVNGAGANGRGDLLLKDLQTGKSRVLVENAFAAAWSSDSRAIAYFADGKLKTISIEGGPPTILCDARPEGTPAWSGNTVLFPQYSTSPAIYSVPATGGTPQKLLGLQVLTDAVKLPWWPQFLPDGKQIFAIQIVNRPGGGPIQHDLVISDLAGHTRQLSSSIDSRVVYADGYLLFVRDGALLAQRFDPAKAEFSGDPQPLIDRLYYFRNTGNAAFSVSNNGVLVWCSARNGGRLAWIDRNGAAEKTIATGVFDGDARLSPDGNRVAATVVDTNGAGDIWVYDLARESSERVTFLPMDEKAPVWAPDGKAIYHRIDGSGPPDIAVHPLNADRSTIVYRGPEVEEPHDISPDGRWLLYVVQTSRGADIKVLPLSPPGPPRPFLVTQFDEQSPRFSPDGNMVAYASDVSGNPEIYVRPFDGSGGAVRVSREGGTRPRWRRDGKELCFLAPDFRVMSVPMDSGKPGPPAVLFRAAGAVDFDIDPSGRRFLVTLEDGTSEPPIHIMTNWPARLREARP